MSDIAQKLQQVQDKVAARSREVDKAQGALDTVTKTLKEEFGCTSLADAKTKLSELEAREKELTEELTEAVAKFEETWKDVLGS